jgi:hypothetical protein
MILRESISEMLKMLKDEEKHIANAVLEDLSLEELEIVEPEPLID